MKKQLLIGHFLTLLTGGFIYILFRPDTLKMFGWFDKLNFTESLEQIRNITLPYLDHLPNWFLYSLPDGLWLFSYISLLLAIWGNEITKQNILWLFLIPIIAIFSEIGQFISIVPGTFDMMDMAFYVSGVVLPILLFSRPLKTGNLYFLHKK